MCAQDLHASKPTEEWQRKVATTALVCSVCGNGSFSDTKVLWPELVEEWAIGPEEVAYIDRQQGTKCLSCGTSLRGMALATAILRHLGQDNTLDQMVAPQLRILDINGCDGVSNALRRLPGYDRHDHPKVDMHAMPFADAAYDLVVHSDTLEHVADPVLALSECLRVVSSHGAVIFTVPMIVGRLSRSRAGLKESYHGAPSFADRKDFVVHTEFGADCWTYVLRAGASSVTITTTEYPTAQALTMRR